MQIPFDSLMEVWSYQKAVHLKQAPSFSDRTLGELAATAIAIDGGGAGGCDRISAIQRESVEIPWEFGIPRNSKRKQSQIPTSWFYLFWTKTGFKLIRPNVQENGPRNEACNSCRSFHVKFLMCKYSGFQWISLCSAGNWKPSQLGVNICAAQRRAAGSHFSLKHPFQFAQCAPSHPPPTLRRFM